MIPTSLVPLTALLLNLFVGIAALVSNPRRAVNRSFFVMSALAGLWLLSLASAFSSTTPGSAIFWIRQCHAVGFVFFTAFYCLGNSIIRPEDGPGACCLRLPIWLALDVVMVAVCQSPLLIPAVSISGGDGTSPVPLPHFGTAFPAYVILVLIKCGAILALLLRNVFRATGVARSELQFTLLGLGACLVLGVSTTMVMPALTGDSRPVQIAPFWVILMNLIISYGIATRRLMDIASLLRRITAYMLLGSYLCALFVGVWWLAARALARLGLPTEPWASLLAALPTVLSVIPASGWMRAVANRLFINFEGMDIARAVARANLLLRGISTTHRLFEEFSKSLCAAAGTDRVWLALPGQPRHPPNPNCAVMTLIPWDESRPWASLLREIGGPITTEMIPRMRPSPEVEAAYREMRQFGATAAFGITGDQGLRGAVLLGARLSGRAYSHDDLDALQLLCNQLSLALDNASLFTQVTDAKIYTDVLLDNLVSGVIAIDRQGTVTVFNREAQRITGLPSERVLRRPIDALPSVLRDALAEMSIGGQAIKDRDAKVARPDGEEIPIRMGTSCFGDGESPLGALLVFSDLTAIRALELQLRRQDRLAGIGTLSAGMAHEIKNPLVAIKTFTDLLPERYDDADFRQTFSSLVGYEVRRIDSIVNQLLSFSRKTTAPMRPVEIRDTVERAIQVTRHQLRSRGIAVRREIDGMEGTVFGDPNQLLQVLLNLILNAVEVMPGGGEITIRSGPSSSASPASVTLAVSDTGPGIPEGDIDHVFDAFFTTKAEGTGLGLAVVHWIIQDHGGAIRVESSHSGTTFLITLPAHRKAVAA